MTSAHVAASARLSTVKPASSAFAFDLESGLQADDDLDSGVAQVLRVRVTLRSVADDGDLLALDDGQVGVVVIENLGHWWFSLISGAGGSRSSDSWWSCSPVESLGTVKL